MVISRPALTMFRVASALTQHHLLSCGWACSTPAICIQCVLQVQEIYPYSSNTQAGDLVKLAEDMVYTSDTEYDRVRQVLSFSEVVSGNASAGLIASIDAIVNTSASYSNVFSKENDVGTMSDTSSFGSWGSRHVAATVLIVLVCLGAAAGAGFAVFKRYAARSRHYTLYDTNVQMSST